MTPPLTNRERVIIGTWGLLVGIVAGAWLLEGLGVEVWQVLR